MQYHIKGPFTCDCCDKQFGLQSTLNNHKKIHRKKDYVCSKVCDCDHRKKVTQATMSTRNRDTWKIRTFSVISANANTRQQANYQPIVTKCIELSRGHNLKF